MEILIAEDDYVSRRLLQNMLENLGYNVFVAEDGLKAWEFYQKKQIKMIITDWMMPGLSGLEVCRKIRDSETPSLAYIIMLTSKVRKKDIVAGLDAGANDYIIKPFEPEELRARVQVGQRVIELQSALAARVQEIQDALSHIKTLQGILPICSFCHKIRDDQDAWQRLESYITLHSEVKFSHSLCPDCLKKHYSQPK